ncbi:MAG: uncharacterized protein A8A55_1215 [Amphiamblys sp. WSBS2006]|nr:MAG: uncharacterized protein A8A55_1215 [Amphiamblys sp. WSBS2006]
MTPETACPAKTNKLAPEWEKEAEIPLREIKHLLKLCQNIAEKSSSDTAVFKTALPKIRKNISKIEENLQRYAERKKRAEKPSETCEEETIYTEKLVFDFLVKQKYDATASEMKHLLEQSHPVSPLSNESFFAEMNEIKSTLMNKRCTEALKWTAENRPRLKRINSTFEEELRTQEFIALCEKKKHSQAICFFRRFLVSFFQEKIAKEKELAGLLAFKGKLPGKYQEKKTDKRWGDLAEQFQTDFLTVTGLQNTHSLERILETGLSLFKTKSCGDRKSSECPTCIPFLRPLTKDILCSAQPRSILLCSCCGEKTTDTNPPMLLPNGKVYCLDSVTKHTNTQKNTFQCPITGAEISLAEIKKMFIF